MKKVFVLAMIISFIWVLPTMAWQNPCSATENAYTCGGYTLDDWVETGPHFSPAPECTGTVTLWAPDGTGCPLKYIGNNGIMNIAGVACSVSNDGDLVCKIITQPEESTMLLLEQEK